MRRGNMLRAAMYVLNIVLTGLFFSASAIALYGWVLEMCNGNYSALKTFSMPSLLNVFAEFRGRGNSHEVFHMAIILWLVIVVVTVLSWWQRASRRNMLVRVVVTTWFTLIIYLCSSVEIIAPMFLPRLMTYLNYNHSPLDNNYEFARVIFWVYYLSSRVLLLLFLALVGRNLYRMIARGRCPDQ